MNIVSTPPDAPDARPATDAPDVPGASHTPDAPGGSAAPARRDAEATKAAILRAARHLLARQAHADITLKAVAERAGVSPPLILKYFGNKDALFARVMSFEADADTFLDGPLEDLGRHMVRQILVGQRERGADPVLRIAFAPLQGEHGDVLRANFRAQVLDRLTARLTGPDAAVRAELALATLLGLGMMLGIARGPQLRSRPIEDIVDRYGPTVQAHLTDRPS